MRTFLVAFIGGIVGSIFTSALVIAWSGPASAPPNGNVAAPINVGTVDQVKNSGLALNALAVFGNSIMQAASYMNWGTVVGANGYGFRDNNGVMEFRNSGGTWAPVASTSAAAPSGGGAGTSFIITTNMQNVNLYSFAGSPGAVANYTITVNPGVIVGSSNASNPSISTGIWPAGSTVTLINNGLIYGKGGDGKSFFSNGIGGTAISLEYNLTINNTNGTIGGGGGGGGGGGSAGVLSCQAGSSSPGGGGGGQGSLNSNTSLTSGNGGQGTATAPGAGGSPTNTCGGSAGYGGSGGTLGNAGASGTSGSGGSGSSGGAGGKAISLNGKTVTWLGGNNSTQVKGVVQ